jgi:hypothetical protein
MMKVAALMVYIHAYNKRGVSHERALPIETWFGVYDHVP